MHVEHPSLESKGPSGGKGAKGGKKARNQGGKEARKEITPTWGAPVPHVMSRDKPNTTVSSDHEVPHGRPHPPISMVQSVDARAENDIYTGLPAMYYESERYHTSKAAPCLRAVRRRIERDGLCSKSASHPALATIAPSSVFRDTSLYNTSGLFQNVSCLSRQGKRHCRLKESTMYELRTSQVWHEVLHGGGRLGRGQPLLRALMERR